jgi:glycosyltransferase involved in cell wall biosynthesis
VVSAIIPARNEEASIARAVESVAAQPEVGEVIVVDDGSTDGTAAILKDLASGLPKLSVLPAGELPVGWVGKNHAVAVGAAAAHGDWLLFTDADTYHLPGAMARALADAAEHRAALVSYSPEQEMETWWERAVIPFVYCALANRYSYASVNNPELPDAAANGQFLMVRQSVYTEIGGHGAVAGEMLEDVALAQAIKAADHRIYFSAPVGVVRTRMYRSFRAMWEGWTKNLYLLFPPDATELKDKDMVLGISYTAILAAFAYLIRERLRMAESVVIWSVILLSLVLTHAQYGFMLWRSRFPIRFIQYGIVGSWLCLVMWAVSWWKNTHGAVEWKGRKYRTRVQQT